MIVQPMDLQLLKNLSVGISTACFFCIWDKNKEKLMSPVAYFCCRLISQPLLDSLCTASYWTLFPLLQLISLHGTHLWWLYRGLVSWAVVLLSMDCLQNRKWLDDEPACEYFMVFLHPGWKFLSKSLCWMSLRKNLQSSMEAFPNTSKTNLWVCTCVCVCVKGFNGTFCELPQTSAVSLSRPHCFVPLQHIGRLTHPNWAQESPST